MRVLLTGAAGFVGRHLHRAMDDLEWDVRAIDLRPAPGVMVHDALDFFRDETSRYDLSVHCAAIVGGRASIDGSPLGVGTNLALDSWYMRWLVKTGTPRAVYFSSSAAYPIELQQPGPIHRLTESDIDLDNPRTPDATYGLAKLTGENLARYAEAEGCRVHIFRPMSGYGEDQDTCYPFPAFIQRAHQRQDAFQVWGSGESTRDWVHVDDIVGSVLAGIEQDVVGPVNIGTGEATSFDRLAHLVTSAAGYQPPLEHVHHAPQGVHHRVCDPSRMLDFYQPRINLEEGIQRALRVAAS